MDFWIWIAILATIVILIAWKPQWFLAVPLAFLAGLPVILVVLIVVVPILVILGIVLLPILGFVVLIVTLAVTATIVSVPVAIVADRFSTRRQGDE